MKFWNRVINVMPKASLPSRGARVEILSVVRDDGISEVAPLAGSEG